MSVSWLAYELFSRPSNKQLWPKVVDGIPHSRLHIHIFCNIHIFCYVYIPHSTSIFEILQLADICICLPPDRTWHKVNDTKVDYSENLGEGKIGHEPRFQLCCTMLVIDPLGAMSVWWT